jgi:glucose-6-phosphate-specific signal transduction histidine kinase
MDRASVVSAPLCRRRLARRAELKASVNDGPLQVEVHDDGIGGADPSGNGLVGMADRVSALGGRLNVESPAGEGPVVTATLPLTAAWPEVRSRHLRATSRDPATDSARPQTIS